MKIGVLMGGISSEREISLLSGKEVIANLNKDKYEKVVPIIINSKKDAVEKLQNANIDFAFLALHGKFGEDGTIQSVLESLGIPYSGCGVLPSSIGMNKDVAKRIAVSAGIVTAPWTVVRNVEEIDYKKIKDIGYPVFIKPNNGGSSVATFFVKGEDEVKAAVEEGLKYDSQVIIEKYIKGPEITSFVLNGEVFPTLTIVAKKGEFFDYVSKYEDGGAEEIFIPLDEKLQSRVNHVSKTLWNVLGCKGYLRVDMIVENGIPYFLEINTLPGLTSASLIPKSAKFNGMEYSELLDKIIEYSL